MGQLQWLGREISPSLPAAPNFLHYFLRDPLAASPFLLREIMVEELPTYAPDLNPEEECHGDVKRHLLNATSEDTRQNRKQANRGFARLRHRPDLILAFFHHVGYRVKRLT